MLINFPLRVLFFFLVNENLPVPVNNLQLLEEFSGDEDEDKSA